jgi:hypothetical protein
MDGGGALDGIDSSAAAFAPQEIQPARENDQYPPKRKESAHQEGMIRLLPMVNAETRIATDAKRAERLKASKAFWWVDLGESGDSALVKFTGEGEFIDVAANMGTQSDDRRSQNYPSAECTRQYKSKISEKESIFLTE